MIKLKYGWNLPKGNFTICDSVICPPVRRIVFLLQLLPLALVYILISFFPVLPDAEFLGKDPPGSAENQSRIVFTDVICAESRVDHWICICTYADF